MNAISIQIDKFAVFAQAQQISAYRGARNPEIAQSGEPSFQTYETTALVDADLGLMDNFFNQFLATAHNVLRDKFLNHSETNNIYDLKLQVFDSFDPALVPQAENTAFNAAVDFILAQWYNLTLPTLVQPHAQSSIALLHQLQAIISHKQRPRL